jgi:pyridinium-3,5-bisthiocarboxylic acid mononucleotide nickel chelatase
MRIAYFDCFSGVSGNMVLGALIDAGLAVDRLQEELDKLGVEGLHLACTPTIRQAIAGVHVEVHAHGHSVAPADEHHLELAGHAHGEASQQHHHRHPEDLLELIRQSSLDERVRRDSVRIFQRLAAAEATVHGTDPEHVHLHEVGSLDAVADVVGSVAGLALLGVDQIYASPLRLGCGFVECAHGRYPVPVPGVLALCDGVPCEQTEIQAELVTPTGAAIITTLATGYGSSPGFCQTAVGYGAGSRELDRVPNFLRLRVGDTPALWDEDSLLVLETNIDDMNPEIIGYVTGLLLQRGAKDVFITPVQMKKGRPGSLLTVLAAEPELDTVVQTILTETTSIGVRYHRVQRRKLSRKSATVETEYGPVGVKICDLDGTPRGNPEYEDCARLAQQRGVPLLSVYAAARAALARE